MFENFGPLGRFLAKAFYVGFLKQPSAAVYGREKNLALRAVWLILGIL